jgi:O-acetylhomoserine (thiol)-lyase
MNTSKRRSPAADPRTLALATRAIHGSDLRPFRGPVAPPIVQTSTFRFADSGDAVRYAHGDPDVYVYTRYHNPTVKQAQDRLALVMNSEKALLFSSGMAAIAAAIFTGTRAGEEILSTPSLYGGTYRLFRDILPDHGIGVRYIRTPWRPFPRLPRAVRGSSIAKRRRIPPSGSWISGVSSPPSGKRRSGTARAC